MPFQSICSRWRRRGEGLLGYPLPSLAGAEQLPESRRGGWEFRAFLLAGARHARRQLMPVIRLVDIKVAVEGNAVGRIHHKGMHLLDEIGIVHAGVSVVAMVEAPLGNRERLSMILREPGPVGQAARTLDDPILPDFLLA